MWHRHNCYKIFALRKNALFKWINCSVNISSNYGFCLNKKKLNETKILRVRPLNCCTTDIMRLKYKMLYSRCLHRFLFRLHRFYFYVFFILYFCSFFFKDSCIIFHLTLAFFLWYVFNRRWSDPLEN